MENTEQKASETKDGGVVADRRLYLVRAKQGVADAVAGERVVEAGDPEAGYLLACAGDTIPADQVKALGLTIVDGKVTQSGDEAPVTKKAAKKKSGE